MISTLFMNKNPIPLTASIASGNQKSTIIVISGDKGNQLRRVDMLRNVTSCQEAISLTRPFGEARLSLFRETFQDPVLGSDFVDVPRQFFPYMSFPGHWKIWGFTSGLSYSRDL